MASTLALASDAVTEAVVDAALTGRLDRFDWFGVAKAITAAHASDLGFPITERTDHEQA